MKDNRWDYFYDMLLLGYEVINVSYKKVMKNAELRRQQEIYKDFVKEHFDKKMIADYFKFGVKAQIFHDNRTGKILGDDDQLFTGFADSKYQYTIRRQPLAAINQKREMLAKMVLDELEKREKGQQDGKIL